MSNLSATLTKIDSVVANFKHGWCTVEKAHALAAAVFTLRPAVIVEIGVWGGRSLFPMAIAAKAVGNGQVIAIDPWSADESAKGLNGKHLDWWRQVNHEEIYQFFRGQMQSLNLGNITVERNRSDDVKPPANIGLLHLDGNHHSQQIIRDIDRFASRVMMGGLCFCDDLNWDGDDRKWSAMGLLASMGFIERYKMDTGVMLQRAMI